ncbi:phenol hydroxylase [Nitrincola sp. A-D6]|jgi:phenol hydroxylase P0 protein|uniref:phenol hydroxylase subunit n=1 Tax=Nitrincola sp. A-D6 TaxID=1545442 RepID=UPI00051F90F1|nr:phenol hydroxylase subunit [Nitrincola sp. A-D6]KGK41351.1 phenol hydroxylase [Nitrincola sp. A-D6]
MPDLQLHTNTTSKARSSFERLTKYIRVRSDAGARFVEFDFAIGDPSLFVELIMPPGAFEAFCKNNHVIHMTDEQMAEVDAELQKWRYGEDTLMSRNHNRSA